MLHPTAASGRSLLARCCVLVGAWLLSSHHLTPQPLPAAPPPKTIGQIEFYGNTAFPASELQGLLRTRVATPGVLYRILSFYASQLQRNPATPSALVHELRNTLSSIAAELPTADLRTIQADVEALRLFYFQQGFHQAKVTFHLSDAPDGTQTLRFLITEGPAARIDTVVYTGLEELPTELQRELRRFRRLRRGSRFRQATLIEEAEAIQRFLQEHGFPAATYERPQIFIAPERNTDSIVIRFVPGPRLRFGEAHFRESTTNAPPLTERARRYSLEFRPGQWYDIRAVERTRLRLLRLGVFETVRIDTFATDPTAGTVDLLISTRYRRPREATISTSIYRTVLESAPNIGLEAQVTDANLFGGAERGHLWGQVGLRDPFGALERGYLEYEFQFGAGVWLPYAARRIGMSSRLSYGIRVLASPLRLEALSLQLRLPVEFAPWTWMTTSELALDIRAERPINYSRAVAAVDTVPALAAFLRQYERLYTYTRNGQRLLPPSDITLSLTLGAEHRDNPTNPTRGHVAFSTVELGGLGAMGLAQYVRLQLLLLGFLPVNPRTVLAGKLRFGNIWWRNRAWSYVPYDRHFFAGGANSVRGWASRSLWDPVSGGLSTGIGGTLASYIGAALLVEGSCELRWRPPAARAGFLSPILQQLLVTGFLDWGNAYNRLTPSLYGTLRPKDLFRRLALSAGTGIGYLTDVGPIRLDVALRLHDPLRPTAPWFFQRPFSESRWALHLGLGHAF
ncbi:MAG: BamA/TamA family outer membrane protein [Chlorobiota bacterium]